MAQFQLSYEEYTQLTKSRSLWRHRLPGRLVSIVFGVLLLLIPAYFGQWLWVVFVLIVLVFVLKQDRADEKGFYSDRFKSGPVSLSLDSTSLMLESGGNRLQLSHQQIHSIINYETSAIIQYFCGLNVLIPKTYLSSEEASLLDKVSAQV